MGHSSDAQEMADAVAWLHQRLPPLAPPSEAELRAMSNADLKRLAASRWGRLPFDASSRTRLAPADAIMRPRT